MSLARATAALLTVAVAGCGTHEDKQVSRPARDQPQQQAPTLAKPAFPIPRGTGPLAAMARLRGMTLRDRPGGKVIAHLRPTTEYGSPTVVWAPQRRGRWLGVV